jgi:hypothetical protein
MTKIAYCLLVHKNPKQVSRLIRNIYSSSDFFYTNVFGNNSARENWKDELKEFEGDNFFVVYKYAKAWGTVQLVNATLECMKKCDCLDYDYFINLSGQCYPLKSIYSIKKFLQDKNLAYMEVFEIPRGAPKGWGKRGGLNRLQFSYYSNPFFVLADILLNKISGSTKYETKRLIRLPRINRQLPYKLKPYGGSTWFCLTKKHVDYILEYLRGKPDLLDFFRRTFAPDEIFFQTIIMNSPLKDTVMNDNLRYIDWSKKGVPLPALLTIDDVDNLLSSSKLFARKFDIELDEEILDLIDSHKN